MKSSTVKTLLVLLFAAALAAGCGKETTTERPNSGNPGSGDKSGQTDTTAVTGDASKARVSNIDYTPCHQDSYKGHVHPDSVSLRYDNGTVYVTHYNLTVNCAFQEGGIIVYMTTRGSRITINEYENPDGPQADCMCETDNSFQINNVPPGTYTFVFKNWNPSPYTMECTF
ncbi:MAG: hypothetical protein K5650_01105 [Bacteroidales bacterium]|nr:hypothetical protein [Bacteroidales bacterium]